ncbi:MAG: L-rhamnose mutarotase [Planctomycetes bacterium]|nr:L-rhamnose mutarotase [Planctomycetota bacterium]
MNRICFLYKAKEDQLAAYKKAHEPVWPEMLQAMQDVGISNYSQFCREDGLLVGYLEVEGDPGEALSKLAETDASKRWKEYMSPFFEPVAPGLANDEPQMLEQYFYME